MDFLDKINELFQDWALYLDLRAVSITGKPGLWLLEDNQEVTAYHQPENCYRALTRLAVESAGEPDGGDVYYALEPNRASDEMEGQIETQPDGGYLFIG